MKKLIALLAIFILLVSCLRDEVPIFTKIDNREMAEIKHTFEHSAKDLQYPECLTSKIPTKSSDTNIVPDWEKATVYRGYNVATYMIPIMEPGKYSAVLTKSFGHIKYANESGVRISSHLVLQKVNGRDSLLRFVSTIVGISSEGSDEPFSYVGNKSSFDGFELLSTESGHLFKVTKFYRGQSFHMVIRNVDSSAPYYNSFKEGVSFFRTKVSTKGGDGSGYSTGEDEDIYCYSCHRLSSFTLGYCSNCGAPPEVIGNDDWFYFCPVCGQAEQYCLCDSSNNSACSVCQSNPCICVSVCPFCGLGNCDGSCISENGGSPGSQNPTNQYGSPYRPNSSDIVLQNIPIVPTQITMNDCFTTSLSFLSSLFGSSKNQLEFVQYYYNLSGENVYLDGADYTSEAFYDTINHFFTVSADTDVFTAINAGHAVLCAVLINSTSGPSYHCITIVGYTQDNSYLIFADSLEGSLRKGDPSVLYDQSPYTYYISGTKF